MRGTLLAALLAAALAATFALVYLMRGGGTERSGREGAVPEDASPAESTPASGRRPAREPPPPAREAGPARLAGRVVDPEGRAVAGARVSSSLESVQADPAGGFTILDGPPFMVVAEGFLPLVRVDWREVFRLSRAAVLSGRVSDAQGSAVAGALVYAISSEHVLLDNPDPSNAVRTDRDGRFQFPGLAAGTTDIGARAPGFLTTLRRDFVVPADGRIALDLTLERGRRVTAVVAPALPYATVLAADVRLRGMLLPPGQLSDLATFPVGRAFSDYPVVEAQVQERGGICILEGVAPGPCDLIASAQGYLSEPGLGHLLDSLADHVDLTLTPAATLDLRVFDAVTRQPLQPAVRRRSEGLRDLLPVKEGVVPADDRRHSLVLELAGYETATVEVPRMEPGGRGSLDVLMQQGGKGDSGSFWLLFDPPLEGRLAVVGRDATRGWQRNPDPPDEEGRWLVAGLPAGEFAVTVLATGKVPVVLPRVPVGASRETYRVTLADGGGLELKVTDAAGNLLDSVFLRLEDGAGTQIDVHILTHVSGGRGFLSVNYLPSAATARADSGLAPGAYRITASREGFQPGSDSFTIAGTEVAKVTLVLGK